MTSRKDYAAVAAAIYAEAKRAPQDDRTIHMRIANAIANVFAADNPRFNRARFIEACGLGEKRCVVKSLWEN